MDITIGADPELFVTEGGKYRSAYGLIPGTKKSPFKVNKGAVQVDGMALEFNIDPVRTSEEFVTNCETVLGELRNLVPDKYEFSIVPSCRFNGNHFNAQPDEAKELGCDPDWNAYTLAQNPAPNAETTMRTAAGHIHIGFCEDADITDDNHLIRCATLVKQLDGYLGLPSVLFDRDTKRRSLYGKAGAFRPKPYGLEYRVLSNAWLKSPELMRFVFDQTTRAVNDLIDGERAIEKISEINLASIINNSDHWSASNYIDRLFGSDMVVKLRSVFQTKKI